MIIKKFLKVFLYFLATLILISFIIGYFVYRDVPLFLLILGALWYISALLYTHSL